MGARRRLRKRPSGGSAALTALLAGFVAASLTGCSEESVVIRGVGSIASERRELRQIDELVLSGDLDIDIHLVVAVAADGDSPDTIVWIEGASDLIEYVETIPTGSTLRIAYRDGVRLDPLPSIEVQCSRLVRISAMGSGTVRIAGLGVGLRPGEGVEVEAYGTVSIRASGEVESLALAQAGACELHFMEVSATFVDHSAAGSGAAWVHATDRVTTTLLGASHLHVAGPATVEETVLGSGGVYRIVHEASER